MSCDTGTSELGRVCYGDARRHMTGYVTPTTVVITVGSLLCFLNSQHCEIIPQTSAEIMGNRDGL